MCGSFETCTSCPHDCCGILFVSSSLRFSSPISPLLFFSHFFLSSFLIFIYKQDLPNVSVVAVITDSARVAVCAFASSTGLDPLAAHVCSNKKIVRETKAKLLIDLQNTINPSALGLIIQIPRCRWEQKH